MTDPSCRARFVVEREPPVVERKLSGSQHTALQVRIRRAGEDTRIGGELSPDEGAFVVVDPFFEAADRVEGDLHDATAAPVGDVGAEEGVQGDRVQSYCVQ